MTGLSLCLWMGAGPYLISVHKDDLYFLPTHVVAETAAKETWEYHEWLKVNSWRYEELRFLSHKKKVYEAWCCWSDLKNAWRCHQQGGSNRLFSCEEYLRSLRTRIGSDDYYSGIMPRPYKLVRAE